MYIIRYVVNSPGDLRTGGASRATPHPALRALEPLASRARSTRRNAPPATHALVMRHLPSSSSARVRTPASAPKSASCVR